MLIQIDTAGGHKISDKWKNTEFSEFLFEFVPKPAANERHPLMTTYFCIRDDDHIYIQIKQQTEGHITVVSSDFL